MSTPADAAWAPLPIIERAMADWLGTLALPGNLEDSVRYSLLGGGKRVRGLLAWHACSAVGARGERAMAAAIAVELVHCFSLVHDDLPAMDDDAMRRGRPTLHVHAGEGMAILAGDAMLALAFRALVELVEDEMVLATLVAELAQSTTGMITGQVYDTLGGLPAAMNQPEQLALIHHHKTGALIRAACRMGAELGLSSLAANDHAVAIDPEEAMEAISRAGEAIGLMYQIVDDLLDVEQTSEHAGKRTGKDEAAGKLTYPGVLGVEASRSEINRLTTQALAALAPLGPPARPLRLLCEELAGRPK